MFSSRLLTPCRAVSARAFHSSPPRRIVHRVKSADAFKSAISQHERVLVDCFASWCGPCKAIAPILEEYSEDAALKNKIRFVKFDTDELPQVAQELGVRAMPTFFLFRDGAKVDELVGADPSALLRALKKIAA